MIMTRSIVFFRLASERVWSTKVSQRPLQSSGSSTPTTKKTAAFGKTKARFSSSRTRKCWNYITLIIMEDIFTHEPDIRLLICAWTGPFSKLWTTVLAILVRCPMYPLLMPPADLYTQGREAFILQLLAKKTTKKNSIQNYLGD